MIDYTQMKTRILKETYSDHSVKFFPQYEYWGWNYFQIDIGIDEMVPVERDTLEAARQFIELQKNKKERALVSTEIIDN